MDGVMEWGSDGAVANKIFASSRGASARSLRICGNSAHCVIGDCTIGAGNEVNDDVLVVVTAALTDAADAVRAHQREALRQHAR